MTADHAGDQQPAPLELHDDDDRGIVVRWDDDTRHLVAALYGDAFLEELETEFTAYARAQLAAGTETPGPGAPPDGALRGEDEPRPDAGGPGRAHPDEATS